MKAREEPLRSALETGSLAVIVAEGTRRRPAVAGAGLSRPHSGWSRAVTPVVAPAVEPPRSGGPRRGRSRPSASPSSGFGKLLEFHEDRRVVERGALSPRDLQVPVQTVPHVTAR